LRLLRVELLWIVQKSQNAIYGAETLYFGRSSLNRGFKSQSKFDLHLTYLFGKGVSGRMEPAFALGAFQPQIDRNLIEVASHHGSACSPGSDHHQALCIPNRQSDSSTEYPEEHRHDGHTSSE